MTSDQKRPPPTHGTRAAIMSPGLNAAAQSGSYGRGTRRGLPAVQVYQAATVSASARFTGQRSCLLVSIVKVYRLFRSTGQRPCVSVIEVYRPSKFTGHRGLPAVEVYRPSRFTGRRSLPAVQVYRPATSSPGRQGLPASGPAY
jgi:hypothetical protein